jgi:hypothetical protein
LGLVSVGYEREVYDDFREATNEITVKIGPVTVVKSTFGDNGQNQTYERGVAGGVSAFLPGFLSGKSEMELNENLSGRYVEIKGNVGASSRSSDSASSDVSGIELEATVHINIDRSGWRSWQDRAGTALRR